MDTVVALLSAVTRALRGLFDMVLMAVGVAPTSISVGDSVSLLQQARETNERPIDVLHVNPSTGYAQMFGPDMPDVAGYSPGQSPRD